MNLLEKNPVLREILEKRTTQTPSGEPVPLDSFLDAESAEALCRHLRSQQPERVVEVGMANGISTLAMLTALDENGGSGSLTSIDPNQSTQWRDCGRAAVRRAGLERRHRVLEEPDWVALPRLLGEGRPVNFAYIDGWHTFDYALLDFWYLDKMLPAGGVVAFNDCGWPAVEKVIRFVLSHRKYEELDVGLPKVYARPSGVIDVLRTIKNRRMGDYWRQRQDRYFRKLEAWEPSWDFFKNF